MYMFANRKWYEYAGGLLLVLVIMFVVEPAYRAANEWRLANACPTLCTAEENDVIEIGEVAARIGRNFASLAKPSESVRSPSQISTESADLTFADLGGELEVTGVDQFTCEQLVDKVDVTWINDTPVKKFEAAAKVACRPGGNLIRAKKSAT